MKLPPVDGKANQELIQLLTKKYQVAKSKIIIKTGTTAKIKLIKIQIDEN
ncbi:hypothetical protein CFPU101_22970 [Chroococcus sp. FPU101]|nr:hypothetical protein CFPU101_22970 [Chroococcus sp. FPU101]